MLLAVALASGSVAVTGNLSFVGLLAPHAAKLVVRKENHWTFILSSLFGSVFVLSADIVARVILPSGEIPTGILIAFWCAIFSVCIVYQTKTRAEQLKFIKRQEGQSLLGLLFFYLYIYLKVRLLFFFFPIPFYERRKGDFWSK